MQEIIKYHFLSYNMRPDNVTILTKMAIKVDESCCLCYIKRKKKQRDDGNIVKFQILLYQLETKSPCVVSCANNRRKKDADVRAGIELRKTEQELSC